MLFFFNNAATTEIYTLPLHDALPICDTVEADPEPVWRQPDRQRDRGCVPGERADHDRPDADAGGGQRDRRSEEHTSELQSRQYLVCRLLLEKKTLPRAALVHQRFPRS